MSSKVQWLCQEVDPEVPKEIKEAHKQLFLPITRLTAGAQKGRVIR